MYVHADEHGAATTIVKNHLQPRDISPVSLTQAGAAAICRSRAWDAKVVTSAWWVHAHQVSKAAPTGEALATGSFMIRGRKTYLPPTPMVMGFTFLFRLDETSVARHRGERAVACGGDDPTSSAAAGSEGAAGTDAHTGGAVEEAGANGETPGGGAAAPGLAGVPAAALSATVAVIRRDADVRALTPTWPQVYRRMLSRECRQGTGKGPQVQSPASRLGWQQVRECRHVWMRVVVWQRMPLGVSTTGKLKRWIRIHRRRKTTMSCWRLSWMARLAKQVLRICCNASTGARLSGGLECMQCR